MPDQKPMHLDFFYKLTIKTGINPDFLFESDQRGSKSQSKDASMFHLR